MGRFKKVTPQADLHVRRKELSHYVELRLDRFLQEEVVPGVQATVDASQSDFSEAMALYVEELVVRKLTEAGYRVAAAPGGLVAPDGAALGSAPQAIVDVSGAPLRMVGAAPAAP